MKPQPSSLNTDNLTVSIAMATYNGERHLAEQLDSLLAQTTPPSELVVTDDNSSDNTVEILEDFSRRANFPVRIYRNETRLGYYRNFLRAASLCRSELIAFCDQDDMWKPEKLQTCLREFTDPEVLLCAHSGLIWDATGLRGRCPAYGKKRSFAPLRIYPLLSSYGFAMVFRRTLLSIADFTGTMGGEEPMAHDQWVWFLASVFGRVVLLPSELVYYRQHDSNTCGVDSKSIQDVVTGLIVAKDYEASAKRELLASRRLLSIAQVCSPGWRSAAESGARFFTRCAEINQRRSVLHNPQSRLVRRAQVFMSLLVRGGYSLGQFAARLGLRASVKDAFWGVFRIQRLTTWGR